jgi:tetratricopeptide (TPR) repeat protein
MKGQQLVSLANFSAAMFLVPFSLLVTLVVLFLLMSPLGSPLFKIIAAWAMRQKYHALAARMYVRLYDWHELTGGETFARQAAWAFEQAGDFRRALEFYEKGEDWAKLGQLLLETGQLEKAVSIFQAYNMPARLAFCYEQAGNYLAAGEIYERELGNTLKALRFYEKALQQDELTLANRIRVRLMMARAFHHLDKPDEYQLNLKLAERLWDHSLGHVLEYLEALHAEVAALSGPY